MARRTHHVNHRARFHHDPSSMARVHFVCIGCRIAEDAGCERRNAVEPLRQETETACPRRNYDAQTASHAANTLNGSRILSCMRNSGFFDRRRRMTDGAATGPSVRFASSIDPNHIERGFRMVLELIAQDALAAVERVF